jgi:group I intron endonuclease
MQKRKSGVYHILNLKNNKSYIGSSMDIKIRLINHKRELTTNAHSNHKLQRAWNKYGEASFEFKVLVLCHPSELLYWEQYWIDQTQYEKSRFGFGYNILKLAYSPTGYEHTELAKQKLRESWTPDRKKKRALETLSYNQNRVFSAETREKISKTKLLRCC